MPSADSEDDLRDGSVDERSAGPMMARRILGARLRALREQAGLDRAAAGRAIRASEAKIRRLEKGASAFKRRDVEDLLTLYDVTDPADRAVLLDLVDQANAPGWWREYADLVPPWLETYLGLEQSASVIRTWEVQFVPGLLQTPDYARAVITHGDSILRSDEIDRWVALRMRRQRILFPPNEVRLWAIVDEGALLRRIGGPAVMRGQLTHLLDMAELPNVTIQVLRLDGPQNPRALRPVTMLRAAADILPDVAYCENLCGARFFDNPADTVRFLDLLNWLSVHAASPRETPGILRAIIARLDAEQPAASQRRG
ncbi:helix-turn-helix protein [Thermopolyspora flexuosa]|uniref:Helix-turn-helix protein n=1 Tax=Thermopolyspora flexuosa TaxID=103836 RepID=A0A543IWG0_9ACTN|nr:helix-turn-helix protein [Thermopolyspora flexuosa]